MTEKKALVIAPHADDEAYGMGGTILRLKKDGWNVKVVVVTCGDGFVFEHSNERSSRDIRMAEFEAVSSALGVEFEMLRFTEESMLDTVPLRDIVGQIERVQDEFKAKRWYVAGPSFHQDHRVTFEAAMAAARPSRALPPKEVWLFETALYSWSPQCWKLTPHVYVDITNEIDGKIRVCNMYESQIRKSGPLCPERLRAWAAACGSECGVEHAERFEIVRIVI